MPRHARLKLAGYPLHLVQRGVDRCSTFRTMGDYVLYLGLLNELAPLMGCELHAYVLMTNHTHILMTPRSPTGASELMQRLGQRYVQHFNRAHGRIGPLWEGRFHSSLVDSEDYFFNCQRYIELNPVRAGMVGHPADYAWSSHRANAGLEPSTVLVPHLQYRGLGTTPEHRAACYRKLFRHPLTDEEVQSIRDAINGNYALGSEAFVAHIERTTQRKAKPGMPGRPKKAKPVPPDRKSGSVPGFRAGGGR